MEIVKSMNLNKIPQNVPNGSLVFAKNIKITDDGTGITADDGFTRAFTNNSINGTIVGFISCVEEIVVFSFDSTTKKSYIYRLKEIDNGTSLSVNEVFSAWTYSGGIIKGTYTYNVNKELIISIAESPKNDDSINIPLKTINLDTCSEVDLEAAYEVAPRIPIANMKLISKQFGNNMPNGLYYFFIRYEITKDVYTKWFPIGIPQYGLALKNKTLIDHHYQNGTNTNVAQALYTHVNGIYNSYSSDCPYNFKFRVDLNKTYNYNSFQIGYILQHRASTVARIWRTFDCNVETEFVFDAKNAKEVELNDLLDNAFNLFNIENITNYENRLYIANYKETNYNENLQAYADNVKARLGYKEIDNSQTAIESLKTIIYTFTSGDKSFTLELPSNKTFIRIWDYTNLVTWFQSILGREFNENAIVFNHPNTSTITLKDTYLLLTNSVIVFYDKNKTNITQYYYDHSDNDIILKRSAYVVSLRFARDKITISGTPNTKYSASIYIDNVIRTLLPNNVYNFFIHYVREDGTFTNGLKIKNDKGIEPNSYIQALDSNNNVIQTIDIQLAKTTKITVANTQTQDKTLSDITELKDKYLYELFSNPYNIGKGIGKFGYYKNYNNDSLFVTGNSYSTKLKAFIRNTICFNNIEIPKGFVGFFISYEKPENLIVANIKCIDAEKSLFKASDVEVGLNNYIGSMYHGICVSDDTGALSDISITESYYAYIKSASISISNIQTDIDGVKVNTIGKEGVIHLDLKDYNGNPFVPTLNEIGQIRVFNRNIYCNKDKILIPFGPIVAGEAGKKYSYGEFNEYPKPIGEDNGWTITEEEFDHIGEDNPYPNPVANADYNLPGFITTDKYLQYTRPIYIDDNSGKVYDIDSNNNIAKDPTSVNEYYAKLISYTKHCNFNLDALSIKKEPEILVGVIGDEKSANPTKNVNTVVKPINATDLIEYKNDFIENNHKVYTCFDITRRDTSVKRSTLRRSNVIQDESVENSWRNFSSNAYKVINKNKGNITNLIGVGNMFYIHTEHSMLSMDKNSMLKTENQDIQLATPDLFDVEPQELFTGQHGFGGLQLKDAWCLNQNGYWFYDSSNKRFYNFDNNKLNDISLDIIDWINSRNISDVRFVTDFKTDRVLISVRFNSTDIKDDYATFSFNMTTKKYISTHDYYFTESINTKNNAYFFDSILTNILYKYDSANIGDYKLLANNTFGFPENHEVVTVLTKDVANRYQRRTINASVVDVIFNSEYEIPRMLESISYILNKVYDYENVNLSRMSEPFTDDGTHKDINRYSGDMLRIYTDQTDTGNLDISQDVAKGINLLNSYKIPHYERGVWQLNYFRNYINAIDIDKELMQRFSISSLEYLTDEELKRYNQIKANYSLSDNKSLIYGKYIVIRFIFKNKDDRRPFVLNNVSVNVKPY